VALQAAFYPLTAGAPAVISLRTSCTNTNFQLGT
jgi:hypothetical protein